MNNDGLGFFDKICSISLTGENFGKTCFSVHSSLGPNFQFVQTRGQHVASPGDFADPYMAPSEILEHPLVSVEFGCGQDLRSREQCDGSF